MAGIANLERACLRAEVCRPVGGGREMRRQRRDGVRTTGGEAGEGVHRGGG